MPINQSNLTVFIPAKNRETMDPRGDVEGVLDTFKGYSIFSYQRDEMERYHTRCLTPEVAQGAILPNSLLYCPGISSQKANEFNYSVLSNNWQRFSDPIPVSITNSYYDGGGNYIFESLFPWLVPSISVDPLDGYNHYYYGGNASRVKTILRSKFSFPILASWGDSPLDNPDVEMQEVSNSHEADSIVNSVFLQEEGEEKTLHLTQFSPLEPGQLRLWLSSVSGKNTCIVEEHPSDNYEGSTEGLEAFSQEMMNIMEAKARPHDHQLMVQLDVTRSNGYNATEKAADPGNWVITGIRSPNTALSSRGPVTPWHFGLPDLTSGTPEDAPEFQIY